MIKLPKHTWVINLPGLFDRARPDSSGKTTLDLRSALHEDAQKIANYRPLIATAPGETAQTVGKAFSLMFQKAPVVTSWALQCDFEEAKKKVRERPSEVWESIELHNKENYRVVILIPEP